MKKYLSFGGGVNSVAMLLLLLKEKGSYDEAIFVDHGADWPETYEYFNMLQEWLAENGHDQITVLSPDIGTVEGQRFDRLFDYYEFKKNVPTRRYRDCTRRAKIAPIRKYVETPCFMLLGISDDEAHRAKISTKKSIENRYPLIEREISRDDCKKIIASSGLPVPIRSGCFCCPFQRKSQFRTLRRKHPDLFCQIEKIENAAAKEHSGRNVYLKGVPIRDYIDESQMSLFDADEYPPCQCGL